MLDVARQAYKEANDDVAELVTKLGGRVTIPVRYVISSDAGCRSL